ncbi:MAG: hypothetical protein ACE5HE_12670 [Phycisphaerae bacterium]
MVFRQHVGPYWKLGPVVASLREYMLERGQNGAIFIRYLDSPAAVPAESLRTEVGFFVEGELTPEPPYTAGLRQSQFVASMVVDRSRAAPRRCEAMLRRWALARGHIPEGSITEIHAWSSDTNVADRSVEVQMVIRPMTSERTPAGSRTGSRLRRPPVRGLAEQVAQSEVGAKAESAPRDRGSGAASAGASTSDVAGDTGAVASVRTLVDLGRFDDVAQLLMPTGTRLPQTLHVWFGQVVYRMGAIVKGLEQVYPGQDSVAKGLNGAIRRRYEVFSADFALDPRDEPFLRLDPHSDPTAGTKRAIMHDLDTMLGGIALTRIDVKEADGRLIDIIQRTLELVTAELNRPRRGARD